MPVKLWHKVEMDTASMHNSSVELKTTQFELTSLKPVKLSHKMKSTQT